MSLPTVDIARGRAGPDDWAKLLAIDPGLLDVASARDEILRRLTGPAAAIVLGFYFSLGALLRLAGLDVARLTGHNAFGLFGLEAAFNGIALLVLSAPLGLVALGTDRARSYRRHFVDWILQRPLGDAYAYLSAVEGETGLIWRFIEPVDRPLQPDSPSKPSGAAPALQGWHGDEWATLYRASREGDIDGIDLDAYGDAVRFLQDWWRLRAIGWDAPEEWERSTADGEDREDRSGKRFGE